MARNSAIKQIRALFLDNVGRVLTSAEISEAAKIHNWGRRIRQLRNEYGLDILSHNHHDGLRPGEYILLDATERPPAHRKVSKKVRSMVFDRDGYTCQMCGAVAGEQHPHEPTQKVRLQLAHVVDLSRGGSNDESNFVTACSICNEGASNITPERPTAHDLLVQIRRANKKEQLAILEWLTSKHGSR